MPKARVPFDHHRYLELKAQGLSHRKIAEDLGIRESTLRDNLKVRQQHQEQGTPMADQDLHAAQMQPPADTVPQDGLKGDLRLPQPPAEDIPQGDTGVHAVDLETLLPGLAAELKDMLGWWKERQRTTREPGEKFERVTYHVSPRWIEAVRREANRTGESYAAVVNRAFAQYFAGKWT